MGDDLDIWRAVHLVIGLPGSTGLGCQVALLVDSIH